MNQIYDPKIVWPQVLEAIASGQCVSGMSSNAHMSYFLSTNASWCDLKLVGQVQQPGRRGWGGA